MSHVMQFPNIISVGTALPKQSLNNQHLGKILKLTHDWIIQNVGVKERKIISGDENGVYLAILAAERAIRNSGYSSNDIDFIVVATATAEYQFPGMSCLIKNYLGIEDGYALDIMGACGGFISALNVASNAIKCKQSKNALVIGVDTLTKVVSWENSISSLFGDGAGAVILSTNGDQKILDINLTTKSKYNSLLSLVNSNISAQIPTIIMDEPRFIKSATKLLMEQIKCILKQNYLHIQDLKWIVPQQVHIKILDNLIDKLGINRKQMIITIGEHANTGAASIPLALEHAMQSELFKVKDRILLLEVTSGLSVGTVLIEYSTNLVKLR